MHYWDSPKTLAEFAILLPATEIIVSEALKPVRAVLSADAKPITVILQSDGNVHSISRRRTRAAVGAALAGSGTERSVYEDGVVPVSVPEFVSVVVVPSVPELTVLPGG